MRFIIALCFSALLIAQPYQAEDFSKLSQKVKGLSPGLLEMHIKLYEGYVKNTNALLALLEKETNPIPFGALKRRMGWEMDGMLLHEAYFSNLGFSRAIDPQSELYKDIERDFGSYSAWEKDFKMTGMIRGIGWVILYRDPKDKRLCNVWINEHDLGHIAGGTPLLVMDVWEHAYITEFGLNRAGYIDTFFQNINWPVVEARSNGYLRSESSGT